jgi:hypothetical protein
MPGIDPRWVVAAVVLAALVVAWVLAARWRAARRREAARAVALAMGLEYREELAAPDPALAGLDLTSRGDRLRLRNALTGTRDGLHVVLGDLHFVTGTGKHRFAHEESLCVVRGGAFALPPVLVRERIPMFAAFDREQGIDLGADEAFAASFAVTAASEDGARALLTAPVREHLKGLVGRWIAVETRGDAVAVAAARPLQPEGLPELLEVTMKLRAALTSSHTGASRREPS